jgi:hypothetical protein
MLEVLHKTHLSDPVPASRRTPRWRDAEVLTSRNIWIRVEIALCGFVWERLDG